VNTIAPGLFMDADDCRHAAGSTRQPGGNFAVSQRLVSRKSFGMMVDQMVRNPVLNGEVIRLDSALRYGPR